MNTKVCTKCGRELPHSEFGKHKITKDGLNYWCMECNREREKIWRATPAGIYSNIKGRSKFYGGRPVSISKENFIEWYENAQKVCAYCDVSEEDLPLTKDTVNARTVKLNIDRIDNPKGYAKNNLVLCCQRCNYIKSDFFSFEEMREIGQRYVKPRWKIAREI